MRSAGAAPRNSGRLYRIPSLGAGLSWSGAMLMDR